MIEILIGVIIGAVAYISLGLFVFIWEGRTK